MSLYDDLGVDRTADTATIKKAYRKRAKKAHPDSGGTTEEFKSLSLAYDVLSDEEKRARYDATGDTGATFNEIEIIVSHLIIAAFQRDGSNPIRSVLQEVDQRRAGVRQQKAELEFKRNRVQRNLEKFQKANRKTKNPTARDFIVQCLESTIADMKKQLDGLDREITKGTAILEYLNDIKFDDSSASQPFGYRSSTLLSTWA